MKIVGHRGAAGYAPENTKLSFETAIMIGCDRAELDVRLSKDNHVVVIHDKEISRVTNGTGLVHELSLEQLQSFELPDGQTIPTLQEVIDFCKGRIDVQIELKARGTPKPVHKILMQKSFADHAIITSFDAELLKEIKELNPELVVGLLFKEDSETIWESVEWIPVDIIGPRASIVTEELVKKAHSRGITVYAYHVNEKETGEALRALGVDEIGTDFPKLFIDP